MTDAADGFPLGIAAAFVLVLVLRAAGTAPDVLTAPGRAATFFISHPDVYSALVALLAGVAGMLSLTTAKSGALLGVLISWELFYLFSCRSLTGPAWRAGVFANRWVVAGVTAQAAGQLALTYLPVMNRLFQTAPITGGTWLRILILALAASLIVAADKRMTRRRRRSAAKPPPGPTPDPAQRTDLLPEPRIRSG